MDELKTIEEAMRKMLDGMGTPYESGWKIYRIAFENAGKSPGLLWPLWLIWGGLTDRYELQPDNRAMVEDEMLRASREWLAVTSKSSEERKLYLDRWVNELGYG